MRINTEIKSTDDDRAYGQQAERCKQVVETGRFPNSPSHKHCKFT